jgi:SsrA-binding protein
MSTSKEVTVNRKAFHDYHILERLEAGIVLTGTEIKSIRAGRVNIRHAYAKVEDGELWLLGAHVSHHPGGGIYNHEPSRDRKLLVHRDEIRRLQGQISQKGITLVPLRIYIKKHRAKVELGLVRGKRVYDKRQTIKRREMDREAQRAVRRRV